MKYLAIAITIFSAQAFAWTEHALEHTDYLYEDPDLGPYYEHAKAVRDNGVSWQWKLSVRGQLTRYTDPLEACRAAAALAYNEPVTEVAIHDPATQRSSRFYKVTDVLETFNMQGQLICQMKRVPPHTPHTYWAFTYPINAVYPHPATCEQKNDLSMWNHSVSGYYNGQLQMCIDGKGLSSNAPDGRWDECIVLMDGPHLLEHTFMTYEDVPYPHPNEFFTVEGWSVIPHTEAILWQSDLIELFGVEPDYAVVGIMPTHDDGGEYPDSKHFTCIRWN